ncbi:EGF-like domain protein [Ancylostoma caninum]|uniref:EGF-like domain protein n=1 Tax=Ancylostoma caninum TaxID=29170 RepID=A0A368GH05_ANCCA|nr:EGF-like domain protein [Ancylostoma caninum]
MCRSGFKGATCNESMEVCSASTCQNGGTCIDGIDGYVCQCSPGFVGSRCERSKGFIKTSSGKTREGPSKCASCAQKVGNGKCDEECNLAECDYDGNDCLVKNPFDGCPSSSFCALVFKNGVCDECTSLQGWKLGIWFIKERTSFLDAKRREGL